MFLIRLTLYIPGEYPKQIRLAFACYQFYLILYCTYEFEWDEDKNQINIRKHGFSFADAWELFGAPMLIDRDDRIDYGEDRWIGIGLFQSRIVVVLYPEADDETIRIISLRKALNYERHTYEQEFGN